MGGLGNHEMLNVEYGTLRMKNSRGNGGCYGNNNGNDANEDAENETARTIGLFLLSRGTMAFCNQSIFRRWNAVDLIFGDLDNISARPEDVLGIGEEVSISMGIGNWWNPLLHGEMRSGTEGREEGIDFGGLRWIAWEWDELVPHLTMGG